MGAGQGGGLSGRPGGDSRIRLKWVQGDCWGGGGWSGGGGGQHVAGRHLSAHHYLSCTPLYLSAHHYLSCISVVPLSTPLPVMHLRCTSQHTSTCHGSLAFLLHSVLCHNMHASLVLYHNTPCLPCACVQEAEQQSPPGLHRTPGAQPGQPEWCVAATLVPRQPAQLEWCVAARLDPRQPDQPEWCVAARL